MGFVKKILLGLGALLVLLLGAAYFILPALNDRQTSGELALNGLSAPVRVVRDEKDMPYIHAETLDDAFRAQGFVLGQDRLFQMETLKRAATGRLSEVLGRGEDDAILNLDRSTRVIGFHRIAAKQAALLSAGAKSQLVTFIEGLNAYITTRQKTHPLEFRLAGFKPEIWTLQDLLSVALYFGWASSANFDAELIALQTISAIGEDAFYEIAPLTVNPDDATPAIATAASTLNIPAYSGNGQTVNKLASAALAAWRPSEMGGSNNWAVSGAKAGQKAAIVTNDPHLDSRSLPGPWHAVGFILPDNRIVGVSTGLPGVVVGRNEHLAFGVTNAYADAVDLYIETADPTRDGHYLEGEASIPFTTVTETIRIKDKASNSGILEEDITIRFTKRGPVISEHLPDVPNDTLLSLRWATAEYMGSELGIDAIMSATTIEEALASIETIRTISLNFVVGDVTGRVARRASGVAPIRVRGNGMKPFRVTNGEDNWAGRIPASEMPGEIDPPRGWTGSANHQTAGADYPYIYTTYASPAFRYRRVIELMSKPQVTAEAAWNAQYDTLNLFARDVTPAMVNALKEADDREVRDLATLLANWDYQDRLDGIETTVFQEIIKHLAMMTFEDEMGKATATAYLSSWYVWQERFRAMLLAGTSPWFDDKRTAPVEDLADLTRKAAKAALDSLGDRYGTKRSDWQWAKVHQLRFIGPLRQSGFIGGLTGNKAVPMAGSGETLLRALYPISDRFDPRWTASLRMTADLNDSDKVRAVLPGGIVGRTFTPHLSDQTDLWAKKDAKVYWWFSDNAIAANARSTLTLTP